MKNLSAGSTPLDFAYAVHTDVGHRCVGAKVNGKIVPLHYQLKSGDIVEILTAKQERGPSRDWLALVRTSRARNKIRAFLTRERREDAERRGPRGAPGRAAQARAAAAADRRLAAARRRHPRDGLPQGRRLLRRLGQGKISPKTVANKVFQRLKQGEAVAGDETEARLAGVLEGRDERQRRTEEASDYGIKVKGVDDVMVRLAKCCRPVPGDAIVGYVSLGRGITIHREDCKNVDGAEKSPGALHRGLLGRATTRPRTGSSSRSTPGTAPACSRTSRGPSPRPGSTSSRRRARPSTRWSRTASWSRSATPSSCAVHRAAAQRRLGVRRLPRHADRLSAWPRRPPVSVVVPFVGDARRRAPGARARPARARADDELIVADNSTGGGARPSGRRRRACVARRRERSSYHARNVGAAAGAREWILFMDADCVPHPEAPRRLLRQPPASGAGARAADRRRSRGLHRSPATRAIAQVLDPGCRPRRGGHAATGNLLVRRRAFERARRLRRGDPLGRRRRLPPAPGSMPEGGSPARPARGGPSTSGAVRAAGHGRPLRARARGGSTGATRASAPRCSPAPAARVGAAATALEPARRTGAIAAGRLPADRRRSG